ncbi:hypothetical protein [Treponema sp.]|uniref:hypothetical protein n=1 Tax=Treponema sp. TaxID=166 RepID=UPI00298D70DE|nr:hypothetical protein [Treponema sp.]MCQ2241589.1 hypothetical protein [Treponema sp.]
MKKLNFPATIIMVSLTIISVSCIKRPPDVIPETIEITPQNNEEEVSEHEQPTESLVDAKVLSPKSWLCLLGRDDKMHQILPLGFGEDLSVIQLNGSEILMETDGTTYFRAVYKEVEYWMDKDSIAMECQNALILEKAILYADMDFTLATDEKNSPFRFGDAVFRSTRAEDESELFDRIHYYDRNSKKVKSAYIKKGLLSNQKDDIIVMDCVKQLRVTKRATPRNEIFRRAAKYKPCPKVAAALEAEKTEKIENNYQDVLNALPGAKYKVNVPELLTVDQSKDPFQ